MKKAIWLGIMAAALFTGCGGGGGGGGSGDSASSANTIKKTGGTVTIVRDGRELSASSGSDIQEGDLIRTGGGSAAFIQLGTDAEISLGENSEYEIIEYSPSSRAAQSSTEDGAFVGWLKGVMRSGTALINTSLPGNTQLKPPSCGKTAYAGIRGTTYYANASLCQAQPDEPIFWVDEGEIEVSIYDSGAVLSENLQVSAGELVQLNGLVRSATDEDMSDRANSFGGYIDLSKYLFPTTNKIYYYTYYSTAVGYERHYQWAGSSTVYDEEVVRDSSGRITNSQKMTYSISTDTISRQDVTGAKLITSRYVKPEDIIFANGDFGCRVVGLKGVYEIQGKTFSDVLETSCTSLEGGTTHYERGRGLATISSYTRSSSN